MSNAKDRGKDAEAAYRKALILTEKLVADAPTHEDLRNLLTACHNNLGVFLAGTGRPGEAEPEYRAAIRTGEVLVDDLRGTPQYPQRRRELARTYENLGRLLAFSNRTQEAATAYRQAIELLESLTAEFREVDPIL